jgi:hypothetical protein
MTRCSWTGGVVDSALGVGLTEGQGAHAELCPECARALAHARRFGRELHRVGMELTPEPAPHDVVTTSDRIGEGSMAWSRLTVGGLVAAVILIGVVFGGGRWMGSVVGNLLDGSSELQGPGAQAVGDAQGDARQAAEDQARQAAKDRALLEQQLTTVRRIEPWFAIALPSAFDSMSRNSVELFQIDLCEDVVVVTFSERDVPDSLRWISGPLDHPADAVGGEGDWRGGQAGAAAQSAEAPPCVTAQPSDANSLILEAVVDGAGVPGDIAPVGVAHIGSDLAIAAVSGHVGVPGADNNDPQRWIGLVRSVDGEWVADSSEWIGANIPANDGLTPYRLEWLQPGLEGWFLVAAVPRDATAIELVVMDEVYRYAVIPDVGGAVFVPPTTFDGSNAAFRVLDADGSVLREGVIRD